MQYIHVYVMNTPCLCPTWIKKVLGPKTNLGINSSYMYIQKFLVLGQVVLFTKLLAMPTNFNWSRLWCEQKTMLKGPKHSSQSVHFTTTTFDQTRNCIWTTNFTPRQKFSQNPYQVIHIFTRETPKADHGNNAVSVRRLKGCWSTIPD